MGPLITPQALERVNGYVSGAEAEGATVVVNGTEQEFEGDGFFTGVSLIDHVRPGIPLVVSGRGAPLNEEPALSSR